MSVAYNVGKKKECKVIIRNGSALLENIKKRIEIKPSSDLLVSFKYELEEKNGAFEVIIEEIEKYTEANGH